MKAATINSRWRIVTLCILIMVAGCAGHQGIVQPDVSGAGSSAVNVVDFGAIGDGTHDDTEAFHMALSRIHDLSGGILFIPSGTYLVGDLVLPNGTLVQGTTVSRPVLFMRPGATNLFRAIPVIDSAGQVLFPHDIQFDSIVLRGRSDIDGFDETHHLLRLIGVNRIKISHVAFEAFQGDGIYFGTNGPNTPNNHNFDVTVTESTFDGVNHQNRNGISFIDCQRCLVENSTFHGVGRFNMPGPIDIEPNHRYEIISDITVRGNTFMNTTGHVGAISVVLGFKDFVLTPSHVIIDHNVIDRTLNGVLIQWSGVATAAPSSLQISIQNNTIRHALRGMVLDGVAGVEITGNLLQSTTQEILLGDKFGVRDLAFRSNQFLQLGTSSGRGMIIRGPVANLTIEQNHFLDVGSGHRTGVVTYFAQGSSTGISFIGNTYLSPRQLTRFAVDAASGFVFNAMSNTWQGNILMDDIAPGTFPAK